MPTLFSRIIDGELPGRFVLREPEVVAFLSIAPLRPGHTLVVPTREVDRWTDLEPAEFTALMRVAHLVGRAVRTAWDAPRAGLIVAGFEVPHAHIHVFPSWGMDDFDFDRAKPVPDQELDEAAEMIRAAL